MCDEIHYRAFQVKPLFITCILPWYETDSLQNISRIDSLKITLQNQVMKK